MTHIMYSRETFLNNLNRLMEERGFNDRSLALTAGLGETFIRDLKKGKTRNPGPDKMVKIANTLQTTVDRLMSEDGQQGMSLPPLHETDAATTIPLYSPSPGLEEGHYYIQQDKKHASIARPPSLEGIPSGFAVYVPDDSMSPKFEQAQTLYVNPLRPAKKGDAVVMITGGGLVRIGLLETWDGHRKKATYQTMDDNQTHAVEAVKTLGLVVGLSMT